jgi:hypothetical protein
MNTILVMLMQIILPSGVSHDIVMETALAPSYEQCEEVRKELPIHAVVAEDGTILRTYFECRKGV